MGQILEEDLTFLEHYGVKGMQWGVRNGGGSGTSKRQVRKEARAKNKKLNQASRAKDIDKYQKDIDKARERVKSGASSKQLEAAVTNYKSNKAKLGSREAKKMIFEARQKHFEEVQKSQQLRDGKEVAATLVVGLGAAVLAGLLSSRT